MFYHSSGGNSAANAAAKSLQSCPTLCDPIDGSPPGSPVPGILQARTLEWVLVTLAVTICILDLASLVAQMIENLDLLLSSKNYQGFPDGSVVKNLPTNVGNMGSIPELGRSLGEENDNLLQYFCQENPMDRGSCRTTIHRVTESDMT